MRIIFVDVDGVLLPRRAWRVPENAAVAGRLRAGAAPAAALAAIRLDPAAVALVLRLCERTDARLTVHSHWRYIAGEETMRAVLVANGIPDILFHPDVCAVTSPFTQDKFRDLQEWLHDHRHEAPDYIVIDDDAIGSGICRAIVPDAAVGFAERDYMRACRMFECAP